MYLNHEKNGRRCLNFLVSINKGNMNNNTQIDPFLVDETCVQRILKEWKEHGKLIIAYDYDNTVFDYYKKGYTYDRVIALLKRCQKIGAHFIVFSTCTDPQYPVMIEYLNKHEIPFDKINENLDFVTFVGRKVYFNILLDDRAGLSAAYNILETAAYRMELENKQ